MSDDQGDESLKNSQKVKTQIMKLHPNVSETENTTTNNDLSFNDEFDIDENIDSDFEELDNKIASIYTREARSMYLHNI